MEAMLKSTSMMLWLGREKEREMIELCKDHMSEIVETVLSLKKMVYAFYKSDEKKMSRAFKEVAARERHADEIKRRIIRELSKGVFHPINREEITRLILTADDIATNAEAASRRLKLVPPTETTEELRKGLRDLSDNLLTMVKLVDEALKVLVKKPRDSIKLTDETERIEEEIDEYRMYRLVPKLVGWINESKAMGFSLMLKEAIDRMEEVADRCEDVADVIRSIVISHA
jgi:hypothetical protein